MKKPEKTERYKHVSGFTDGTDYVEVNTEGQITAVDIHGNRRDLSERWTYEEILEMVEQLNWEPWYTWH